MHSVVQCSTNAKKVTVSVLYWYEKLSSQFILTNFWKRSFGIFFLCPFICLCRRLIGFLFWVRPYLVENTISRPICEVKQPQAWLVLMSEMTREPQVPYPILFHTCVMLRRKFALIGLVGCRCTPWYNVQLTLKKLQFLYFIGMRNFLVSSF